MSDETQQAGGASTDAAPATAETAAAGSQPVEQPTAAPAPPEAAPAAGEPKAEASPAAGDPAKPAEPGPKQEFKPSSRRSAQYRIQQLADENRRLKGQLQGQPPAQDAESPGEPQFDDNAPQPQAPAAPDISQEIERRMEPVLNVHRQAADDQELAELFTGDRAAMRAEYEPRVREAWKLPQYKELAASDVFKILNYESDLARAGTQAVEAYKKAEKDAKQSSGSGSSARKPTDATDSAWDMTEAEFKRKSDEVRASG